MRTIQIYSYNELEPVAKLRAIEEVREELMEKESYEAAGLEDFELFWDNKPVTTLYKAGLLRI